MNGNAMAEDQENPLVSIIVPCFNQASFIGEALDSVLSQSYVDWQCVVIDDGSTDETETIVRSYLSRDDRFVYLKKANGGVASARNLGIKNSSGEFILPLDGDDKLHKDYLRTAMSYFAAHPETDLVYTQVKLFGATRGLNRLPAYDYQRLLFDNMIVSTSVYRRARYDKTSGYAENMRAGLEDWEFYIRLLGPEAKVHRIDTPLFFYRIKKQSRSTEVSKGGHFPELAQQIYNNNRERYLEVVSNPIFFFREMLQIFRPDVVGRYKRQRIYIHCAYWVVILALLATWSVF